MVPASTGAWHNNATVPSYKSPQVEAAKAQLASAGFVDLDLDGYVEAPNGEPFQFRPMWSISAPQWGAAMQSQTVYWDQAGINVQDYPVTFNTLLDLVSTIPRNYEGACFALNIDPEPTYISIWTTEQITNPEGNRANWSNASYDAQIDIFSTSSDYDAVLDACHLAQQIHVEQVPYLIWYSNWEVNAHRTDKWEGFQVSPGWGTASSNRWPPRQVRLQEGQPERDAATGTGGTFHTLIATSMDTQNNLMGTSAYGLTILAQVYQGLTDTNPLTHTVEKYMNALAYDWTQTELADGLQFDFKIYTNATWHDGVPVTAEDIKFSYDYNYNYSIPTYAIAHTYFNSCSVIDDETVRITTNGKSYWAFDYVRSWDIIPKHIWEGIVSPTTFTNPLPIGSGWFKWVRRVEGEFVELDFWELFHRGVPGHTAPEEITVSYLWVYIAVGVVVIVVVLLGSVWYLRKK
jgi:peptide/nickel transport system substrate-binding protein